MFYRKYRPQTIAELDNERIRESLGKSLLSNKFSSAYLLVGSRGTGKTTTARLIAKVLNCDRRKSGDEPCNECETCKTIANGTNLDVIEIDAASNTGVDDIRDLREKVKLAPSSSKYKVYIIDEVHMLSTSAFNALLKTLEEPPSHVVFILATTDPHKLPETIKSRCQVFDFGRGSLPEIVRATERAARGEKLDVGKDAILEIAKMADGSFRDAHKILEQLAAKNNKIELIDVKDLKPTVSVKNINDFLALLENRDSAKIIDWVEGQNLPVKEFIEEIAKILHEDLLINMGVTDAKPKTQLKTLDLKNLLEKLDKAYKELRGTVIAVLPLEVALIEWAQTEETKKVEVKKEALPSPSVATEGFGEARWSQLLEKTKPYNHSLSAVLRSAKPIGLSGKTLMIGVNYKFHLDKLSESKNIEIIEKVLEEIMDTEMRVKYIKQ
ncbi:DNA polymerase III, subunit gamma and tau [Candidatus Gottesmanbacteria bacterium RIFCSPHIGHO2_01_FULL_42_12]|uniref:DNA polymerase III subunit gamma/tau n=1 Tax=Candidatus Gottesmanbacteria bacterium RIFCSPHIGHO2_01_FULL_42_12 TaxID=1798377 RepID=A0A1F5Z5F1_9BACT|nr:MAG: DNA polymerase III, subunit gamma and tau [Candidatus Gottesmanbacteria bacterium RIFCSPHIGHO2_01_FULL_42_12]